MTKKRVRGSFDPNSPICIVGMGVIGTKVAWASARVGISVRCFDLNTVALTESIDRAIEWSDGAERDRVRDRLQAPSSLKRAVEGVQLAFENVPEQLDVKLTVLKELDGMLDTYAFLGSNTSSFKCSTLAAAVDRPERFFALNFTDPRSMRLVELMGNQRTQPAALVFAKSWARSMQLVPIEVRKEQMGYSFNRIWRVVKKEVLRQIDTGIATAADIDRAWMLTFGTSIGPCGLMDQIGLDSVRNVEQMYFNESGDISDQPPASLDRMIADEARGVITGRGFYSYPNPTFGSPGFLDDSDEDNEEDRTILSPAQFRKK
jgi:3-hydroxybutyryl-CoA dehydrogenase